MIVSVAPGSNGAGSCHRQTEPKGGALGGAIAYWRERHGMVPLTQPAFTAYVEYSLNSGLSNNTEGSRLGLMLCKG